MQLQAFYKGRGRDPSSFFIVYLTDGKLRSACYPRGPKPRPPAKQPCPNQCSWRSWRGAPNPRGLLGRKAWLGNTAQSSALHSSEGPGSARPIKPLGKIKQLRFSSAAGGVRSHFASGGPQGCKAQIGDTVETVPPNQSGSRSPDMPGAASPPRNVLRSGGNTAFYPSACNTGGGILPRAKIRTRA